MDSNLGIYEPLQLAGSPTIEIIECNRLSTDEVDRADDTTVIYANESCDQPANALSEETKSFECDVEFESSVFLYDDFESLLESDETPCDCASVSFISKLSQHSYQGGWARFGFDDDPWDDERQPTFGVLNFDDLDLTEEEKDGILTDRVVYACSSFLEKNPESQRLTLSKLVAQDKYISDIKILEAHRYLQYIDLSHNNLRDIWPLSGVPYLMHLDVSHNELTEVLNFKAPWNLTYVDFSFNRVSTINDLSDFWSLVYLNLSNNRINKIEGLMNLRYLNYLNLSMNSITCFENLNNLDIAVLDISRNSIRTFEEGPGVGMRTMLNLSELDISSNNLTTLALFKGVYHVKVCNLEENEVDSLFEIDHMKTMRQLSSLNLSGNGMTRWPKYRAMVINTLRTLAVLDEVLVESRERIGATVQFDPDLHIRAACQLARMQLLSEVEPPPSLGLDVIPFDQGPYPLIVLVGPDGSMKEHLINWIAERFPEKVYKSVCHTTRSKINSEVDGKDYYFVSHQEFNELSRTGTFLYIDEMLGDSYGFSRFEIETAVKQKKLCLVKMELLGALTLKAYGLEPTLVLTITEDETLHYQRLNGKYSASIGASSTCSNVSMGAVSLARRNLKTDSEEKAGDDHSYIATIITDMLTFGITPSLLGSTTVCASLQRGESEKLPHPDLKDSRVNTLQGAEQDTLQQNTTSSISSAPSLIDNMSWLNLPYSQRLSTVEDNLKKMGSLNSHSTFSGNSDNRNSIDILDENSNAKHSRDFGIENAYIMPLSKDIGFDNAYMRQSRDNGVDNSYMRQSRDIGFDSSYMRQSRDTGVDNSYVRQSRDIGFDNSYMRQSRDTGVDNSYVRQSRDIGFDNSYMRQSRDTGVDNFYVRQSRDIGFDNSYMRQPRDIGFDNSYMRQSRDIGEVAFDDGSARQSRDHIIDIINKEQSRDVGFDNVNTRQSKDVFVGMSSSIARYQLSKTEEISLSSRASKTSRPIVQFQDQSLSTFNTELFYRPTKDSVTNVSSISEVSDMVNNSTLSNRLTKQESSQSHMTMESPSVSTNIPHQCAEPGCVAVDDDNKRSLTTMKFSQTPFDSAEAICISEEMYMKSILKKREMYFQTHRDNPGTFAETIYTDDILEARKKFERFVMATYKTRPSRYPLFNIEEDKSYQAMMAQRLEQFKQEIYNEQRTMHKQLDEMAKYRAPRVPPQRKPSLIAKEMQRRQKQNQPKTKICNIASF